MFLLQLLKVRLLYLTDYMVKAEIESAVSETVLDPDNVRKSARFQNARMFIKYFKNIRGGKYTVVVVVSDIQP